MDNIFVRNFLILTLLIALSFGAMSFIMISGSKGIDYSSGWVEHTNKVIIQSQELANSIEGMLSAQRAYAITGNKRFLSRYQESKAEFGQTVKILEGLSKDNKSQAARVQQIENSFTKFAQESDPTRKLASPSFIVEVDNLRNDIVRLNDDILREEHALLNSRAALVQQKKNQFLLIFLLSGTMFAAILIVLNGFLLQAQTNRTRAEQRAKDTEERFMLAIQGTNDGIFDWDLKKDKVFFSRQFFGMLGIEQEAYTGQWSDLGPLFHPEDEEKMWQGIKLYLDGVLPEYSNIFRMRHKTGRWIWVSSRGKAIFDKKGDALRLVGAHTDITYMKQYEEQLEEEREEAMKANQAKTDFLAHMSHEIRTPLTAVTGIAEIFEKQRDSLTEKQQLLVKTLHSSTTTLRDLINDILDFSKIEAGELELSHFAFEVKEVFEAVISIMGIAAQQKNLIFEFSYDALKHEILQGDNLRLRQILINLIGNAIKFTEKGSVKVRAYKELIGEREFMRVDIVDTGLGIAPENYALIFERFKQVDATETRRYGGTGLGLSISRSLARLMGGDIYVQGHDGAGSIFSLVIPLIRSQDAIDLIQDAQRVEQRLMDRLRQVITADSQILMVEDYEGNIVVISHILEEIGCKFDVGRTGRQAIDLWQARNHDYDLILMDVQMPEMDGFTATQQIRRIETEKALPRTPIIGMTAHALVGDKDKCIAAGMDSYLPKPIVALDLKQKILDYIRKSSQG